jgi:serine/threonine-protein kinase RsbW
MTHCPTWPASGADHFHRRLPADAESLVPLRAALAGWLAALTPPWPRLQREDIVLATYEALANAVEHAYREVTADDITLECHHADGRLGITVRDTGTWKPATGEDPFRGRGLLLIRSLTSHHTVDHGAGGTIVDMSWRRAEA